MILVKFLYFDLHGGISKYYGFTTKTFISIFIQGTYNIRSVLALVQPYTARISGLMETFFIFINQVLLNVLDWLPF